MSEPEVTVHVEEAISGRCPFCGGQWSAGYMGPARIPSTFHSWPPCTSFEKLEPDAFLREVRKTLES